MSWYNLIAPFYDKAIQRAYRRHRREAVQALQLQAGLTVVDIACGTGLNLEDIVAEIGPQGTLIGIDYSAAKFPLHGHVSSSGMVLVVSGIKP